MTLQHRLVIACVYACRVDAGGKAGDLIVYRTTEQKMPILTPNDTTTYIITRAESSARPALTIVIQVDPPPARVEGLLESSGGLVASGSGSSLQHDTA